MKLDGRFSNFKTLEPLLWMKLESKLIKLGAVGGRGCQGTCPHPLCIQHSYPSPSYPTMVSVSKVCS